MNRLAAIAFAAALIVCGASVAAADKTPARPAKTVAQAFAALPDFSHAGYACGEKEPPKLPVTASVRDFGAKGDGTTDDTAAFEKALATTTAGAVIAPAGRYRLSRPLTLNRSGVVLRGEGPDKTVLFFASSLTDIKPNPVKNSGGTPCSGYSWSGGLIRLEGRGGGKTAATISAEAAKDAQTLQVDATTGLRVGQELRLEMKDSGDRSLGQYLFGGEGGNLSSWNGMGVAQTVRIAGLTPDTVRLDRPLRCATRLAWKPRLVLPGGELTQAGVEELAVEFPVTKYRGHFSEVGYNGFVIGNAAHCWLRNVRIANADSGIFCHAHQCTFDGIEWISARKPDKSGCTGHHGTILGGDGNILRRFKFHTKFIHDITVSSGSMGNVIEDGSGENLALDHHCRAPYENLFCQLDAGLGTRLYHSGGGGNLGRHCGAGEVFWGITARNAIPPPPANWGPRSMLLVGVTAGKSNCRIVPAKPGELLPANPRAAQLERRLKPARASK